MRASAAFVYHRVIERALPLGGLPAAHNLRVEHHAFAGAMFPGENLLEQRIKFVERHAGQKSKAAQIDGQNRNSLTAQRPRCRKQRAVAAEHDQQINFSRQCFARQVGAPWNSTQASRLLVDEHFDLSLAQPLDQRRHDRAKQRL